jgi:ABC-type branched-subunit amino acid transport system substrate-binding protein
MSRRALLLCVLLLSHCLLAHAQKHVVIGQVVDLSGPLGYIGRDFSAGAKTYFDETNARGGINGRKIVFLLRDDRGDPAATLAATHSLLKGEKLSALFGYVGGPGMRAALQSEQVRASGLPLFAPITAIDPEPGPNKVFVLRASIADEIQKIVDHIAPLGMRSVAVVHSGDEYGRAAMDTLGRLLHAANLRLAASPPLGASESDMKAAVDDITASDAQCVLMLTDTFEAARFVQAYRRLHKGTPIFALSRVIPAALVELAGPEASRGVIITQVVPHPHNPHFQISRELIALMSKYRDEPSSHFTMEGFIAAKALVAYLREQGGASKARGGKAGVPTRFDIGDFIVDVQAGPARGSHYVDLTAVTRGGQLLR